MAKTLADYANEGQAFSANMGQGSTFLAPVTAWPALTLTMALWNPERYKRYRIFRVFAFLASGTPDQNGSLVVCVTKIEQARPTLSTGHNAGYASTIVGSLDGRGQGSTRAVFINAIAATGEQPAWFVAASEPGSSTGATIASHGVISGDLGGAPIVEPGNMLGLAMVSGAGATPLYGFGVQWGEERLA